MTTTQMIVGSQAIYNGIVTKGLQLNLDATNSSSYPGAGTTWFDISGNNRNATLVNAPTYETGNTAVGSGSFNFNGTSQYANVTSDMQSVFSSGLPVTIEMWFKNTNTAGSPLSVIASGGAFNYTIFELGFVGPFYTARYFFRSPQAPGTYFGGLGSIAPPVNTWNQYVVTFATGPRTIGYQGPVPATTLGTPSAGTPNTTNGQSWSGTIFPQIARNATTTSGMTNAGNYFAGNIGILRVYNRALTATEIQQNYNASRPYYGL